MPWTSPVGLKYQFLKGESMLFSQKLSFFFVKYSVENLFLVVVRMQFPNSAFTCLRGMDMIQITIPLVNEALQWLIQDSTHQGAPMPKLHENDRIGPRICPPPPQDHPFYTGLCDKMSKFLSPHHRTLILSDVC